MTRPGIEPRSPGPLANTQTITQCPVLRERERQRERERKRERMRERDRKRERVQGIHTVSVFG